MLALVAAACSDDEPVGSDTSIETSVPGPAADSDSSVETSVPVQTAGSDSSVETSVPGRTASSDTSSEIPSAIVETDVAYNENSRKQVLDVYVPAGEGPFPTILAIHGGGFDGGNKRNYRQHAEYFVDRGIAFVSINYRLAPSTAHPGQIEDVHCALAWAHEHADRYRLDPSHIVAMGGSAGGYLTGLLATADDREGYLTECPHDLPDDALAGAVPLYGIFDYRDLDDPEYPPPLMAIVSRLAGVPYDELSPKALASMSPIAQIDGTEPSILAVHGTLDRTTPSALSERFVAELQSAGTEAELMLVEAHHGFDVNQPIETPYVGEVLAAIEQFVTDVG